MDDLPPPYSPPSPRYTAAVPRIVLERAPTLPPSYDEATSGDVTGITASASPQHSSNGRQLQTPPGTRPRPSSFSGGQASASPASLSHQSTSPSASRARLATPQRSQPQSLPIHTAPHHARRASAEPASLPAIHAAAYLTPYERQRPLLQVLRRVPWRRSMGAIPATPEKALHKACLLASEAHVRALVDIGTPITYTDRYAAVKIANGSALHGALLGAAPHLAEYLTQVYWGRVYAAALQNADHDHAQASAVADDKTRSLLDGRDAMGCTPMHMAAQAGATDAARIMLRRGADLDPVDDLGRTPLHMAARYGRDEVAELLISLGAKTAQLMPRPPASQSQDAAVWRWSEYSDADSLWYHASGERLAQLGNYLFVTRFISSIVAKNDKAAMGEPADGAGSRAAEGSERAAYTHEGHRTPAGGDARARKTPSVQGSSRSGPPAGSVVDPCMLSAPLTTPRRKAPRNLWQRVGTGSAAMPEYITWRDDLNMLQQEHRAQRERNKRAEVPDGYDIHGAGGPASGRNK